MFGKGNKSKLGTGGGQNEAVGSLIASVTPESLFHAAQVAGNSDTGIKSSESSLPSIDVDALIGGSAEVLPITVTGGGQKGKLRTDSESTSTSSSTSSLMYIQKKRGNASAPDLYNSVEGEDSNNIHHQQQQHHQHHAHHQQQISTEDKRKSGTLFGWLKNAPEKEKRSGNNAPAPIPGSIAGAIVGAGNLGTLSHPAQKGKFSPKTPTSSLPSETVLSSTESSSAVSTALSASKSTTTPSSSTSSSSAASSSSSSSAAILPSELQASEESSSSATTLPSSKASKEATKIETSAELATLKDSKSAASSTDDFNSHSSSPMTHSVTVATSPSSPMTPQSASTESDSSSISSHHHHRSGSELPQNRHVRSFSATGSSTGLSDFSSSSPSSSGTGAAAGGSVYLMGKSQESNLHRRATVGTGYRKHHHQFSSKSKLFVDGGAVAAMDVIRVEIASSSGNASRASLNSRPGTSGGPGGSAGSISSGMDPLVKTGDLLPLMSARIADDIERHMEQVAFQSPKSLSHSSPDDSDNLLSRSIEGGSQSMTEATRAMAEVDIIERNHDPSHEFSMSPESDSYAFTRSYSLNEMERGKWVNESSGLSAMAKLSKSAEEQLVLTNPSKGKVADSNGPTSAPISSDSKQILTPVASSSTGSSTAGAEVDQKTKYVSLAERIQSLNATEKVVVDDTAESKRRKSEQVRQFVSDELLMTERNYISCLEIIVHNFIHPLQEANDKGKPVISGVAIKLIFAYIEDLMKFNSKFLVDLEEMMKNWGPSTCVGKVFLKFNKEWDIYLKFVDNYGAARTAIQRCEDTSPGYRSFIQECMNKNECQRLGINDHLIVPIQRVTRYVMLLQDIKKHTGPDHDDFEPLTQALEFMRKLASTVNEVKRREEEMRRMFLIQKTVDNCPATLISSHRWHVGELEVTEVSKHRQFNLFLFSDLLMIAKISKDRFGKRNKMKFYNAFRLREVSFTRHVDNASLAKQGAFGLKFNQAPAAAGSALGSQDDVGLRPNDDYVFVSTDVKLRTEFLNSLEVYLSKAANSTAKITGSEASSPRQSFETLSRTSSDSTTSSRTSGEVGKRGGRI